MKTFYQTSNKFLTRNIGDETVVVPVGIRNDKINGFITFSETAGLLWKALSEPKTIDELTILICSEYDAEPDEVKNDVTEFIENCLESEMIIKIEKLAF